MSAAPSQKIYFLSDFHLGAPNSEKSLAREKKICTFLNEIRKDADEIFLMGDLFDFWYEYSKVVPKGYVRLLGTLASISDQGIPLHFFVGNHDMWMFDYLQKELDTPIYREPVIHKIGDKTFFIGHGDGRTFTGILNDFDTVRIWIHRYNFIVANGGCLIIAYKNNPLVRQVQHTRTNELQFLRQYRLHAHTSCSVINTTHDLYANGWSTVINATCN